MHVWNNNTWLGLAVTFVVVWKSVLVGKSLSSASEPFDVFFQTCDGSTYIMHAPTVCVHFFLHLVVYLTCGLTHFSHLAACWCALIATLCADVFLQSRPSFSWNMAAYLSVLHILPSVNTTLWDCHLRNG